MNFSIRSSPDPFGIRQLDPFKTQDRNQAAAQVSSQHEQTQLQKQLQQQNQANDAAVKRNTVNSNPFNTIKIAGGKAVAHSAATAARGMAQGTARSVEELVPSANQLAGVNPPKGGQPIKSGVGKFLFGQAPMQSIQQEAAGAQASHSGGFHIKGTPITLTPKETGIAEGAGKTIMDVATLLGGAKGAKAKVDNFNATTNAAKTTVKNVAVNNALKGVAEDSKVPSPAVTSPPKASSTPVEITPKTAGQGSVQKPNIKEVLGPTVPKAKMAKPSEEGAVAPGQAVADVKDMLAKHQASTRFGGDLEKGSAQVEGSKKVIAEDTAKIIKQRTPLSNADKQTLQDYRDAKAAGLEAKPLPAHLVAEDQAVTELNKAAQAHDAELARLNGQNEKAAAIEARDPTTYTHREAQNKGSSLDYVLQGDRKNPLSVGGLSKTTPSSKRTVLQAVTDEEGSRSIVSIKKGRVTAFDQGGKVKTDLGKLTLKSNADRMQKELEPVQRKIDSLEKEQKILSATKSRSEAASKRLANIKTNLQDAYREHANVTNKYDMNELEGKNFIGKDGKKYTISRGGATEITKATGQKYYVDPKLMALKNYADTRTALENARFIESIKQHPSFSDFASAPGETAPKGWQGVDGLFQFMGYKFDPKIAEVLTDLVKQSPRGIGAKVSNFLRQTIVYFPLKHSLNELATAAVDRGLTSLVNPMAYKRGISSLVEAYHEVTNMGPKFQAAQKAGLHTVTGGDKALESTFKKELLGLREDSPTIHDVAKQWGTSPKRLYNAVQEMTVWQLQDILNMQRVIERTKPTLFGKGASLEDAVAKTQKYNLQYSVPSRVGPKVLPGAARRGLSGALRSKTVFFGRYKYDIYKIATNIIKDTLNPKSLIKNPKQNVQALDKLAAMALGAAVLWPIVDKGIQKATHNANAYMKAPGVLELPSAVNDVRKGNRKPLSEASNQIYLSSAITQGIDLKSNRDSFTGKQIYDPNTSIKQQFSDIGKWVGAQQAPSQQLKQAQGNKSQLGVDILMSLASVRMPKNDPTINNLNSLKFDSLPGERKQFQALVQKGDTQGAKNLANKFNAQVLQAAKKALKAAGQPVPSDQQLYANLKSNQFLLSTSDQTIKNYQKPKQTTIQSLLSNKSTGGRKKTAPTFGLPKP